MVIKDRLIGFSVGVASTVFLVACTGSIFPYKYYPYDIATHTLMGASESGSDDLPDSVCEPTPENAHPCTIIMTMDALNLKGDYLKKSDALNRCEQK